MWTSNSPLFIRRLLQGLAFVFSYFLLASEVTPTRLDKFSWYNEWQALLTYLQFSLAVPVEARTPQKSEALLGHLGFWKCYSRYTLEGGMATHSSILAWRIPRTEEPGGLQSMGPRVGHNGSDIEYTVSTRPWGLSKTLTNLSKAWISWSPDSLSFWPENWNLCMKQEDLYPSDEAVGLPWRSSG